MFLKKMPLAALMSSALSLYALPSLAVEVGGLDLSGSGFLTVVAGKMLSGTRGGKASDNERPLFVSDYAQGGVYDGRGGLQWGPDTKLGLQGTATLPDRRFSVTSQVVARGARGGAADLEWLYGSFKANDNFTFQVGRKRIPMFYYSETQDIGLAMPWTHLPSGPYGWQAVNYNGVNLSYQGQWGTWASAVNLMAGNESVRDSGYQKVYLGKNSRSDVKWDHIRGGDITLSKDWFETRFVYLQSDMRSRVTGNTWDASSDSYTDTAGDYGPTNNQKIYGLAFNVDYNNFIVRSEVIYIDHNAEFLVKDHAYLLGFGYRYGKWTPMLTFSDYHGTATSLGDSSAVEATRMTSLTMRYDLTTSSAVKVQLDVQKDRSGPNFMLDGGSSGVATNRYGDSHLLTVSYDMVF